MVVVFDLDDTLFQEMDFVRSAYRAIARIFGKEYLPGMLHSGSPREAFDSTGLPIDVLLEIYRNHVPDVRLPWMSLYLLASLKNAGHTLGLITDGREVTQRNKIAALGLDRYIAKDMIFISGVYGEGKITGKAMREIMERNPGERYMYVGDNPEKDFVRANEYGWTTVGLIDSGNNVQHYNFGNYDGVLRPDLEIRNVLEVLDFCKS